MESLSQLSRVNRAVGIMSTKRQLGNKLGLGCLLVLFQPTLERT
jgi:hypothetical protein